MKRRRKISGQLVPFRAPEVLLLLLLVCMLEFHSSRFVVSGLMMMMSTNCLSGSPGCSCSWKSGKFVANCSSQSLAKVPKNDYFDYLSSAGGNNQMPTLNRDIQLLDLSSNSIPSLREDEFLVKNFKNLQKIYLNANQLLRVHSGAFHKLTGLVELDLSENFISNLSSDEEQQDDEEVEAGNEDSNQADPTQQIENKRRKKVKMSSRSKSARKLSFLSQLGQLRQLNLAANQLTALEEFAFSPAKQLRQLYLSRNKISFIDKRAFDGLNVLNILHLDGNKLSYLNGEILSQLPQLHSLQLAGTNPWDCDCRLRKLARQLARHSTGKDALNRASIIQDEPRCLVLRTKTANGLQAQEPDNNSGVSHSSSSSASTVVVAAVGSPEPRRQQQQQRQMEMETERKAEEDSRWSRDSWTNMKLDQLECAPKLSGQTRTKDDDEGDDGAGVEISSASMLLMDSSEAEQDDAGDGNERSAVISFRAIDKAAEAPTKGRLGSAAATESLESAPGETIATIRHHYLADELVQLTCLFELNDELDLDYAQLEWWHIMSNPHQHQGVAARREGRRARLIWRSRPATMKDEPGGATKPATTETTRFAPAADGGQAAVIMDYVTRSRVAPSGEVPMNGSMRAPVGLVRVSHLIADPTKLLGGERNGAGRAALLEQEQGGKKKITTTTTKEQAKLMCRITNKAGHAALVHSVLIDSGDRRAKTEARARQVSQDSWLKRSSLADNSRHIPAASLMMMMQPAWPLDQAKARIAEELEHRQQAHREDFSSSSSSATDNSRGPAQRAEEETLFIPLYLSEELLDINSSSSNGSGGAKEEIYSDPAVEDDPATAAARGLSQQQQQQQSDLHQRQATRQTNATASRAGTAPPPADLNSTLKLAAASATQRHRLQSKALALLRRFTAPRGDADMAPAEMDVWPVDGGHSEAAVGTREHSNETGQVSRPWLRAIYVRYVDRWVQFAIGEAPLLLGICISLFAGCLLVTFFLLRLHCSKQRRVRDGPLDPSSTSAVEQQLKTSLSEGCSATNSSVDVNSPDDEDEEDDAVRGSIESRHRQIGGPKSKQHASTRLEELISDPSQQGLISAGKKISTPGSTTTTTTTCVGASILSSSELPCSCDHSDEASINLNTNRDQCSLKLTGRATHTNYDCEDLGGHRLFVLAPQQELQELILSPYSPFGSETGVQDKAGGHLCDHLGQKVIPTVGWQSPLIYHEDQVDSSSLSTSFQNAPRQSELVMNAPSKLRPKETACDSLYQASHYSSSLSRNRGSHAYGTVSRFVGPNYGYASSSSLVTSPAASTSSTSMTSGNQRAQQHYLRACNYRQDQPDLRVGHDNQQQQQQHHDLCLDDALKLLHSSINDCLQ